MQQIKDRGAPNRELNILATSYQNMKDEVEH
jgi:hypothetical protein